MSGLVSCHERGAFLAGCCGAGSLKCLRAWDVFGESLVLAHDSCLLGGYSSSIPVNRYIVYVIRTSHSAVTQQQQ